MRRSTNGGMRIVPRETIIAGIPAEARRSGSSAPPSPTIRHRRRRPRCRRGRPSGRISSLRADKLTDELVGLLAKGGYRTLTSLRTARASACVAWSSARRRPST